MSVFDGFGNWRLTRVVLRKELKDNLRDKRSMSSGFLMPLLGPAMFLLSLTVVVGMNKQDKPLKVPVRGAQYAPSLV